MKVWRLERGGLLLVIFDLNEHTRQLSRNPLTLKLKSPMTEDEALMYMDGHYPIARKEERVTS